jgi:hypothetical protein
LRPKKKEGSKKEKGGDLSPKIPPTKTKPSNQQRRLPSDMTEAKSAMGWWKKMDGGHQMPRTMLSLLQFAFDTVYSALL